MPVIRGRSGAGCWAKAEVIEISAQQMIGFIKPPEERDCSRPREVLEPLLGRAQSRGTSLRRTGEAPVPPRLWSMRLTLTPPPPAHTSSAISRAYAKARDRFPFARFRNWDLIELRRPLSLQSPANRGRE